jgi:thioredoxin-related protein
VEKRKLLQDAFCRIVLDMNSLFLLALLLAGQYQPVKKYDPRRDAAKDIDTAIVEAQRTGRHILLVVGGEWCGWCHTLDNYFESHPQLLELRDRNYITVKVNWSPENMNEKALSRAQFFPAYEAKKVEIAG